MLQQAGETRVDVGDAQHIPVLHADLAGMDDTRLAQYAEMMGQRGLCHIGAWRGFGAGHAIILPEHVFDNVQSHGVSQRAKHAGEADVFSGWVNELNHAHHYSLSIDMVQ